MHNDVARPAPFALPRIAEVITPSAAAQPVRRVARRRCVRYAFSDTLELSIEFHRMV